jgi:hypothetical protein
MTRRIVVECSHSLKVLVSKLLTPCPYAFYNSDLLVVKIDIQFSDEGYVMCLDATRSLADTKAVLLSRSACPLRYFGTGGPDLYLGASRRTRPLPSRRCRPCRLSRSLHSDF